MAGILNFKNFKSNLTPNAKSSHFYHLKKWENQNEKWEKLWNQIKVSVKIIYDLLLFIGLQVHPSGSVRAGSTENQWETPSLCWS